MAEATNSLRRIQRYLNREDIDSNKVRRIKEESNIAIDINGAWFSWPVDRLEKKTNDKSGKNEKSEINETLLDNEIKGVSTSNRFQLIIQDLKLEKGETYFVLGRVGAGKTAFLKAILNELEQHRLDELSGTSNSSFFLESLSSNNLKMDTFNSSKEIHVNGKIAYVSQNNWLQDSSIRVSKGIKYI